MKLIRNILVLFTILCASLAYSNDNFEQLFDLNKVTGYLILTNKKDVKLPEKDLTALHKLYRYINTFGDLQLYISSYSNKFYIVPLSRLNLIYSSAITVKILHEQNNDYFSLVYDEHDNTAELSDNAKTETTFDDIITVETIDDVKKVTIDTSKKITVKDILTNKDSMKHIINQLEYGIFSQTNHIFLRGLYDPEYSKDLLINFQQNEFTIKALISPYNSQFLKYYLCTKLLTSDLANYIASAYKTLLHASKQKKQN